MYRFTAERNVQLLIYLLKAHGIKKIVASPGATNICFVASVQHDDWFEIYSSVDERSAAYIACGLAYESGEPVIITCTGATASRNYFPGLSEAYYRKLPILAITASQDFSRNGHLSPQYIDRTIHPKDAVKLSVQVQNIRDDIDEWDVNCKLNNAILELTRHGGGPVHINLATGYNDDSVDYISPTRVINRHYLGEDYPDIDCYNKIAITVGGHKKWDDRLVSTMEIFCNRYNAIVFIDHSSGYKGEYSVQPTIVATQEKYRSSIFDIDLLIHIGEQHGDYYTNGELCRAKEVWRVNEDGELRDTFKKLTHIFEMSEYDFFEYYIDNCKKGLSCNDYLKECKAEVNHAYELIPELPFSNIWIAQTMAPLLPIGSEVQLGVSNTMRSWTFFKINEGVSSIANIGCRGIDGSLSTTLGMALSNPSIIHYCFLGDLTFFYDMNTLGNREILPNIRILLVNNGVGAEFKLYHHRAEHVLGDESDEFVAARGHYGNKSKALVKHYAEDLGFDYFSASTKDELRDIMPIFLDTNMRTKPIIVEAFTDSEKESEALYIIRNLFTTDMMVMTDKIKGKIKSVVGEEGIRFAKKIIGHEDR